MELHKRQGRRSISAFMGIRFLWVNSIMIIVLHIFVSLIIFFGCSRINDLLSHAQHHNDVFRNAIRILRNLEGKDFCFCRNGGLSNLVCSFHQCLHSNVPSLLTTHLKMPEREREAGKRMKKRAAMQHQMTASRRAVSQS